MSDHTATVANAKSDLIASGADVSGACGAFSILALAVQRLVQSGQEPTLGLLDKPSGNNCGGLSVDVAVWPDGKIVDCLQDAGAANIPRWDVKPDSENVNPDRWRPPVPVPDPSGGVPIPPIPTPVAKPIDLLTPRGIPGLTRGSLLPLFDNAYAVVWPAGSNTVLSVQPDGSFQTRPFNAISVWETATLEGNVLVYRIEGLTFVVPFVHV